MYQHTEEERDGYGKEDTHDDGQGFVCVDKVAEPERVAVVNLDKCQCECTSQQLEHHRNGGGGRHAHRVEDIQQYDIRQHDGK